MYVFIVCFEVIMHIYDPKICSQFGYYGESLPAQEV